MKARKIQLLNPGEDDRHRWGVVGAWATLTVLRNPQTTKNEDAFMLTSSKRHRLAILLFFFELMVRFWIQLVSRGKG